MTGTAKTNRKQQILEVLAQELEKSPGSRITTASLARAVGVSEAALYRHYASKAKMFEALIEFSEESVFGLINRIVAEEKDVVRRCEQMMKVLLGFSERNPGITRILLGDALVGENDRLRVRVGQYFDRLETQFKQVLREASLSPGGSQRVSAAASANLMMSYIEGRMSDYVRGDFSVTPTTHLDEQWQVLSAGLFVSN